MTVIRPADEFGAVLTGRYLASELRERVEELLQHGSTVTIDFSGVEAMSPSFADELFAKAPRDAIDSGRLRFENLADDLRALARFVAEGREPASRHD